MVLAEKNNENARNGRRSRGPSPNGHVQADSTSEDESTVPVDKIRVGRDYQAVCPELQPENQRKPELLTDRALLVWSPTDNIPDYKLEEYIVLAKDKYGYNGEQALGMLFWHKHDLDRAVLDLANFTPFPDDWSVEDKVLFEQAFQFHGKSFHRIKQMLPDKSIASLVKYYYSWKKTRSRSSLMDKQARKLNTPKEEGTQSEVGSEGGSNEESDNDEKGEGGRCSNCGVICTIKQTSPKGSVCNSCFQHWRRTGVQRPTSGPATGGKRGAPPGARHRRKPPRGMYINHDDLVVMASGDAGAQMLKAMEREIDSLQRQIQQNKQQISSLKRKHSDTLEDITTSNSANSGTAGNADPQRFNARWSGEEKLLAVQGLRKYGRDFKSIADILGNKTEHHIRQFFINYRKRYNLDNVLRDWEKDNGIVSEENSEVKLDVEAETNVGTDEVICISPTPSNGSSKKEIKNGKMTPQISEK